MVALAAERVSRRSRCRRQTRGAHVLLRSKDDDFVALYSQTPSASLLWVRLGNCRRAFLRGRQLSSPNSRLRSETAFLDILVLNSRRRGGVNSLYNRVLRDDEDRSLLKPWMKLAHCNRPENRVQEIFNFL